MDKLTATPVAFEISNALLFEEPSMYSENNKSVAVLFNSNNSQCITLAPEISCCIFCSYSKGIASGCSQSITTFKVVTVVLSTLFTYTLYPVTPMLSGG
jgi:hypothetical protein